MPAQDTAAEPNADAAPESLVDLLITEETRA
jgi:hypothetical protein